MDERRRDWLERIRDRVFDICCEEYGPPDSWPQSGDKGYIVLYGRLCRALDAGLAGESADEACGDRAEAGGKQAGNR